MVTCGLPILMILECACKQSTLFLMPRIMQVRKCAKLVKVRLKNFVRSPKNETT